MGRLLFFMKKSLPIPRLLTILFQNHMLSSYPTDLSAEADHETLGCSAAEQESMQPCTWKAFNHDTKKLRQIYVEFSTSRL